MFNNIYKLNKNYLKLIVIIFLYWVSLNTGSKYIYISYNKFFDFGYEQYFDLNTIHNLIRSLFPYLIFFYLIFNKKYLKNFLSNYDFVFICFLFYGIFQLSGLLYTSKNIHEHYWLICLFSLIIYYKNILNNEKEELLNIIFFINLFIIFLLFIVFVSFIFKYNFFMAKSLYNSPAFAIEFANESIPRSSGISRMGLILFIFLNSIYFFCKDKISKNYKFLIFFLNIFIIFIILTMQSRGAILFFFILFFLINLIYNFKSIGDRISYFLLIILIPISLFFLYPLLKNYIIQTNEIKNPYTKELQLEGNLNYKKYFRPDIIATGQKNLNLSQKIIEFSNNRFKAWEYLINVFFEGKVNDKFKKELEIKKYILSSNNFVGNKNIITGLGPQADRYLMRYTPPTLSAKTVLGPYGAHASNIYVYSLVCSGILGLILILAINLAVIYKILIIYKNKKKLNLQSDFILNSSILIILFIQFRGLLENSYGVFGVDLLMFFLSYTVISSKFRKLSG